MANIPNELRALPLEHIIGSPMVAAIKAQALAAQTTVEFIKDVGLKRDDAGDSVDDDTGFEARYVQFTFDRILEERIPPPDGAPPGTQPETRQSIAPSKLTVPLLAIVPIPHLRISDMTTNFEFEIKDIETSERTTSANVSVNAKAGGWFYKVSVKGSYSTRSTQKRETDRRTTLQITVNAVQEQMPEGLGRVLDILMEATRVVPTAAPTPIAIPT